MDHWIVRMGSGGCDSLRQYWNMLAAKIVMVPFSFNREKVIRSGSFSEKDKASRLCLARWHGKSLT